MKTGSVPLCPLLDAAGDPPLDEAGAELGAPPLSELAAGLEDELDDELDVVELDVVVPLVLDAVEQAASTRVALETSAANRTARWFFIDGPPRGAGGA